MPHSNRLFVVLILGKTKVTGVQLKAILYLFVLIGCVKSVGLVTRIAFVSRCKAVKGNKQNTLSFNLDIMKLLDQVRLKCQMLHDYEGIRE